MVLVSPEEGKWRLVPYDFVHLVQKRKFSSLIKSKLNKSQPLNVKITWNASTILSIEPKIDE